MHELHWFIHWVQGHGELRLDRSSHVAVHEDE